MYRIIPPEQPVDVSVSLPLSKSESARALVIDTLSGAAFTDPVAKCDDTRLLRHGLPVRAGYMDIGAAGTAMRFLTAVYAATEGTDVELDGSRRMRERPIGPLVDALRALGADIEYTGEEGFPPLHIRGRLLKAAPLTIDASVSSQFVSALMLIAPALGGAPGLDITLTGEAVSTAYLRLTAAMMAQRGVEVEIHPYSIHISAGKYNREATTVGADWSAASYWYEITALSAGWSILPGLELPSKQGDSAMAAIGARLGVDTAHPDPEDYPDAPADTIQLCASPEQYSRLDYDASDTPDLVQTLAMTAAMLGIPFRLTGISTLRNKETDRIEALVKEARKLGFVFEADGTRALSWEGARVPITQLPVIETYNDHRMAMAFAPCALFFAGLCVRDPQVVTKSYPDYWNHLAKAGFVIQEIPDDADPATYMPE